MGALDFLKSRPVVLGLRIAQLVLSIIVLGLTAYVANWWSGYWHSTAPAQVSFLLFCSVWALLALTFLIVVPLRFSETKANHKFAVLGAEFLTMLFWFAGFLAQAVWLSHRVCFGNVCSAAKAAAVFGAFAWVCFACTFALAVLHVMETRGRVSDNGKSDPNMNVAEGV